MSKVITFSRVFPAYHTRAGKETWFVEKLHRSLDMQNINNSHTQVSHEMMTLFNFTAYAMVQPKHHTIRAGNRWKVGDKFSPRVWSGKPYRSPQIIIAPDIEIKKIWDFEIESDGYRLGEDYINTEKLKEIAKNDGLTADDLELWFAEYKTMKGQIICWNENINY
jgi:hypothetical protein